MEESPPRGRPFYRPLRWTLAAALLVALAVLGYREGYRRGYEPEQLATITTSSLVVKTYPVADLVTPVGSNVPSNVALDFDPLIDLIVSTIEHESWMENGGGEGELQPFPSNASLVVSQTQRVHEQIADLLQQLRRLGTSFDAEQAIPLFHSWAVRGSPTSLCPNLVLGGDEGRQKIDKCFAKTRQSIVDVWGGPSFHGDSDDDGFPEWSRAEELAYWPRGTGVAYIAVELDAESRSQLILGWRPEED